MRSALLLCLALLPAPLRAEMAADVVSPDLSLMEAGMTCRPQVTGTVTAPGTMKGSIAVVRDPMAFVATGRQVPAVLGLGFGVRARLADPGQRREVTIVVTHPPMAPGGVTRESWTATLTGLTSLLNSYRFETEAELVPGDWTISAEAGGKVLFRVPYTVLPADRLPGLAQVCAQREVGA